MSRTLAPLGRRRCTVERVERAGAYVVLFVSDPGGPAPDPGQFAMLATVEGWGAVAGERPHLPRAFSIMRRAGDEVGYLLEDVGPGTRRLCGLRPGDELWTLAPLGRGFAVDPARRALLCGGGVGIAPLAALQDELIAAGAEHEVLLGFRDAEHAAGAVLLRDAALATDDGSVGHHGLVTDLLTTRLDADAGAVVYACGPPGMLESIRDLCARRGVAAQLALEAGMACGYGACYGCVVPTADGAYARVCLDGPVFAGAELAPIGTPA